MIKRFKKFIRMCEHKYILTSEVWLADWDDECRVSNIGFGAVLYHKYTVKFCTNCFKFKREKTGESGIFDWYDEPTGITYVSMDSIKELMNKEV